MTRQLQQPPIEPLVGGESARLVLDTLRTFPLSVAPTGHVLVHNTAVGESADAFARAYEQIELQLITEASRCSHPGEHRTMHPEEYRFLVLAVLAADAKSALGEANRVEGIWASGGPDPHGARSRQQDSRSRPHDARPRPQDVCARPHDARPRQV